MIVLYIFSFKKFLLGSAEWLGISSRFLGYKLIMLLVFTIRLIHEANSQAQVSLSRVRFNIDIAGTLGCLKQN